MKMGGHFHEMTGECQVSDCCHNHWASIVIMITYHNILPLLVCSTGHSTPRCVWGRWVHGQPPWARARAWAPKCTSSTDPQPQQCRGGCPHQGYTYQHLHQVKMRYVCVRVCVHVCVRACVHNMCVCLSVNQSVKCKVYNACFYRSASCQGLPELPECTASIW